MSSLLSNELLKMENDAVLPLESEVTPIIHPIPATSEAAAAGEAAGGARRKKRKMDGAAAHTAIAHSDSEEESEDEVGHLNGRHVHAHWDYTHDFAVPCNKTIIKVSTTSPHQCTRSLFPSSFPSSSSRPPRTHPPTYLFQHYSIQVIELLRKEWKEAIELVGAVKLWIQLSIPPIESGGQFHVGVQEECVQELNRFEDVVCLIRGTAKRAGVWGGGEEGGLWVCERKRLEGPGVYL